MQINYNKNQTFTGYDARQLKGLFATNKDCAREIRAFASQYNLDVYIPNIVSNSIRKEYGTLTERNSILWAQDYFTFLKDKAVLFDASRDFLKRVLRSCADGIGRQLKLKPLQSAPHIRGGNYFNCNVNGKRKLLLSEDKLILPEEILKVFHDADEICPVPKLDYHIDLFLRPLDNGNVLLADNKATTESLNKLFNGYRNLLEQNNLTPSEIEKYQDIADKIEVALKKFELTNEYDKYKPLENEEKIFEALKKYGFNPIKVPGNYHYLESVKSPEREKELLTNFEKNIKTIEEYIKEFPQEMQDFVKGRIALERVMVEKDKTIGVEWETFYDNNFLNAITFKDKNGKIVYITNAPLLDRRLGITAEIEEKTGLSFRNLFLESISPYVDKENIHFISERLTEKLFRYEGGVHCSAAEIPA